MRMHIAPSKCDLQHIVEAGQRHVAADEEAPDQRANALGNYTQLLNTGRKVRDLHGRSLLEERRGFHLPPPESPGPPVGPVRN